MDGWVGFNLLILSRGMCLGTRIKPVEGKNKNIFKQLQLLPGCHAQAHDDTGNLVLVDTLSPQRLARSIASAPITSRPLICR